MSSLTAANRCSNAAVATTRHSNCPQLRRPQTLTNSFTAARLWSILPCRPGAGRGEVHPERDACPGRWHDSLIAEEYILFKKKLTVADYCSGKLTSLLSADREAAWEGLRSRCNDAHLNGADAKLYYDNLRAAMIELMQIAVTKNSSWTSSVSSDVRGFVQTFLQERSLREIASLVAEYNHAFGTPAPDGVVLMVDLLADKVTDARMGEPTKEQFRLEFYGVLRVLFEEFKSIKLVGAT